MLAYEEIGCSLMFDPRKRQRKTCVGSENGIAGDGPTEPFHGHLAETQTDARPVARFGRRVEALEDAFQVLRRDAGSGIFDDDRIETLPAGDERDREFAFSGLVDVVDGIFEQVEEDVYH